jgi:hypothetical protein
MEVPMPSDSVPLNGVLVNTHLLLLVSPHRTPLVTCGPVEGEDHRLSLEVLGHGYGASVHRGPLPVLRQVVTELGTAIDRVGDVT